MRRQLIRGALLASACTIFATEASAQDTPGSTASTPAVASDDDGEVITVTANRRSENLQDIPIAVTAVTATQAEAFGVSRPEDIPQLVPSVALNRSSQGVVPFIRGVGNNSSTIGNEPSVAMYVDDVYVPTGSGAVFYFNNIEQVEVLRGPQGTLFGRNATGGVIHIHTRMPSEDTAVSASVGYGNFDTLTGQFYATTGLSDGLAINFAGFYLNQGDGWGTNVTTGDEVYDQRAWGIRSRLRWDLGPDTRLLLGASFDRRRSDQGQASRQISGSFGRGGFNPDLTAGFYDATTNIDQFYINEAQQYSARLSHDFGRATLVSISAYTKVDGDPSVLDIDASPTPFFNADTGQGSKTFTQEIQLLSSDNNPNFNWILGGFYLHDRAFFRAVFTGQIFGGGTGISDAVQTTDSVSLFAQGGLQILPRTQLTIGVRYTSDHRAFDALAQLISPAGAVTNFGPFVDDTTFSSVTGRISLDYHFTDDIMGYVAFNRGFKSGVYNIAGVAVGTTALPQPVLPEDVNSYTAGFRTEFANGLLRFNAEAYYYDYKNIQVQNVIPGGTILTNGGAATIKGIEFETSLRPMRNLRINWALSFASGHYDSFIGGPKFFPLPPNAQVEIPPGCTPVTPPYPPAAGASPAAQRACDLSGNRTIQTPPFTSNLSVIYTVPTSIGEFNMAASWAVGGNYFFEPDNNPVTRQPRTNVVNASLQWSSPGDQFTARLWVNNLTEERYYTYITESTSSGNKYSPAAPRTYGLTVGVNF